MTVTPTWIQLTHPTLRSILSQRTGSPSHLLSGELRFAAPEPPSRCGARGELARSLGPFHFGDPGGAAAVQPGGDASASGGCCGEKQKDRTNEGGFTTRTSNKSTEDSDGHASLGDGLSYLCVWHFFGEV